MQDEQSKLSSSLDFNDLNSEASIDNLLRQDKERRPHFVNQKSLFSGGSYIRRIPCFVIKGDVSDSDAS